MVDSASLTKQSRGAGASPDTSARASLELHAQTGPEPSDPEPSDNVRDFLIRKDGETYAGSHVLADFWGPNGLTDPDMMDSALREAAEAAGATVLHVHVHSFGNGGVSGVAVLAESHISVHTWPELDYAAFDVFMCGDCRPERAIEYLENHLRPRRADIREHKRGLVE